MSILEELNAPAVWEEFLRYKLDKNHLSSKEQEEWTAFIDNGDYRKVTEHLMEEDFTFSYPTKVCVNKSATHKKRIVYSFAEEESMVLKCMAFLLYRYDDKISRACYSFRRNCSAKDAMERILTIPNLSGKYCFKADISNYFNSIPADKLLKVLQHVITDDEPLNAFLRKLLLAGKVYDNGNLVEEETGAMAGIPIAPFFANIYLGSLDRLFEEKGIPYFRYSDDILFFADTEAELADYQHLLEGHIQDKGLKLNPDKIAVTEPGESWDFLGFSYKSGKIDLSEVTKNKLKAKIKRKAHSLYRWRLRNHADFERTARAMIRTFNRKFYDDTDENRFTWSRWFFPVLSTDEGLKELDAYLVQYIRYLSSGRHYKGNYRVSYEQIKELGFRSLVNEYYRSKLTDSI
ncbi:MAG: hypothetical protein E7291_04250 [Lachnospiraceae bacterium]|nr:hypothetical protein [Lachnospiraceae bacterium]